jgi:cobalt-zinc-cadmium efflux system outer membrane protein
MIKHIVLGLGCMFVWSASAAAPPRQAVRDSLAPPSSVPTARDAAPGPGVFSDTLRITLPDITRLIDEHPRLAAGLLGVDAARGAAAAAGAIPNPAFDASLARDVGAPDRREWSLGLTLPLDWLVQRGHRGGAARAQVAESREEARAIRRDVLLELRSLFWNLTHDQARVAALEVLQGETAELARLVSRRVETGEARPSEVTRIEIELEKVTGELEASRTSLRARQDQLGLWIHQAEGRRLVAEGDLAAIPSVPDLRGALAAVRSGHPSLDAARARIRMLAAEHGAERMARIPGVSVRGFTLEEPERSARGGALALDLPLWNWNSGRIAQARARLEAGRRQLEWETRQIESAVIHVQAACLANAQTALRYRDRILPRSESAARIMEKTYRLGEASLLEVLDARRVLVETRLQHLAVLLQTQLDRSHLDALVGQEEAP